MEVFVNVELKKVEARRKVAKAKRGQPTPSFGDGEGIADGDVAAWVLGGLPCSSVSVASSRVANASATFTSNGASAS